MAVKEIGRSINKMLDISIWPFLWGNLCLKRKIALLERSGLFDAEWYLCQYKDVAEAGIDPLHHYVEFGTNEGREPNATLAVEKNNMDKSDTRES